MVYEWKTGSQHRTDANTAGAVCEHLEASGNLTAKSLLDVSRPEDAPLHSEFEWNDSVAAEKFREDQARGIIRHLTIRLDANPSEPVRSFFTVAQAGAKSYTSIETILTQNGLRDSLLHQAIKEMDAFQRKFNTLSELVGIFEAAAKVRRTAFPVE